MNTGVGKRIKEWIYILAVGFLLAIVIQKTAFALYIVEGSSMMPTIKNHERVFVNRIPLYFGAINRGDIVVFPNPIDDRYFVKRVIGLPGDRISISNGRVYLNGKILHEEYVDTITVGDMEEVTVKEGHVFVMGDNRHPNASWDSRSPDIGQIPISSLAGEAEFVLLPVPHSLK
ncbi:MAG: signal peptidase I [Thermicanus sp.]|nr:signal peptidase I [Thermicanus sp.]